MIKFLKNILNIRNILKMKNKAAGTGDWLTGGYRGYPAAGTFEKYKSYAFACINARAENVSKAKILLYRNQDNGKFKEELSEHGFLSLVRNPNRRGQTFKELLHKISSSLDLYGNAYLYIHRSRNGEPAGLYHLPSKNVRIELNAGLTEIDKYVYFDGKNYTDYARNDIVHFLIPDPDNSFSGKPTIAGFNYTQEIDFLQNLYQKNFYKNGAAVGMVITSDGTIEQTQYERMLQTFRENYEGAQNAGKNLFLECGMKAEPYQASPKDVEILPSRKMIRDEILSIFRVPKIILGITEDVNRANSREAMKIFNDYVVRPFAKICIESKLNIFLRENYDDENLLLDMEYEFEIDRELQLKAIDLYAKYGIATHEELRDIEGFGNKLN